MRRRALTLFTIVIAMFAVSVGSASAANDLGNYSSIVSQFMCVSCHEPLELVSSPQALSEKAYLLGLVNRGLTIGEIQSSMVGQYGPEVLAKPPAKGFNLTVYILPPAVVVGGLLLLAFTLPKWRRRAKLAAETDLPSASPLSDDETERLNAELDQFI